MRLSIDEENRLRSLDTKGKKEEYEKITSAIINSPHNQQLIVSGPGTGKTTIFKGKITKWNEQGINNDKILVISFINYIVDDLSSSLPTDVKIYTLHKLAKMLIHKYLGMGLNFKSKLTENFNIAWECDEINIIGDLIALKDLNDDPKIIKTTIEKYFQTSKISDKPEFIDAYLELVSFYDIITFEDSILRALRTLRDEKSLIDFKKIVVDEYQDFNPSEQRIVKILFDNSDGGIIVGDDDQSIYSSKQADPSGLLSLVSNDDWEKCTLPFCGRCKSQFVVDTAIEICRNQKNPKRKDKTLLALEENDKKIKVINLKSSTSSSKNKNKHFLSEAEYIARCIDKEKVLSWSKNYPAYLVLAKTGLHLTRIAEAIAEKVGIKVGIKEISVYNDEEVQIFFSFLQLLNNSQSNIAYRRLIGLDKSINIKEIFLKAWSKGGFGNLNEKSVKDIKNTLEKIKKLSTKEGSIEELLWNFAKELKLNKDNLLVKKYIDSIKGLPSIEKLIRETEDLIVGEKEKKRKEILSSPIQCLTIWGSKGLKADTVFIIGLEEGYLPKSNTEIEDEEIRLMYVAMTRAIEELHLLFCSTRYDGVHSVFGGTNGPKNKSIFLDWIHNDSIESQILSKSDFL